MVEKSMGKIKERFLQCKKNRGGFTLVEMIVVLVIIAILDFALRLKAPVPVYADDTLSFLNKPQIQLY